MDLKRDMSVFLRSGVHFLAVGSNIRIVVLCVHHLGMLKILENGEIVLVKRQLI